MNHQPRYQYRFVWLGAAYGLLLAALLIGGWLTLRTLHTGNVVALWREDRLGWASFFFERGNHFFGGEPSAYNLPKAEAAFARALGYQNHHGDPIWYQYGRVLFIRGDLQGAVAAFNRQFEEQPDFYRTYYMRGLTYGYLNQFDLASADFERFLTEKPKSWAAHTDLAWVHFRAGDFLKAEAVTRQGLAAVPENPWLNNALGAILISQQRHGEAAPYLEAAVAGFTAMGPAGWGAAYPGNDPRIYEEGWRQTLQTAEENLQLVQVTASGG